MRFREKSITVFVLLFILLVSTSAAETPGARPDDIGISSERLQRIHQLIQRHIVVERASGQKFDQFARQRIFDPLAMKDTFCLSRRVLQSTHRDALSKNQ